MIGNLTVTPNQGSTGNLIVGGFYTPTNQVANNKDNDGGSHPGWLATTQNNFQKMGSKSLVPLIFHARYLQILSWRILAGRENCRSYTDCIQHCTISI